MCQITIDWIASKICQYIGNVWHWVFTLQYATQSKSFRINCNAFRFISFECGIAGIVCSEIYANIFQQIHHYERGNHVRTHQVDLLCFRWIYPPVISSLPADKTKQRGLLNKLFVCKFWLKKPFWCYHPIKSVHYFYRCFTSVHISKPFAKCCSPYVIDTNGIYYGAQQITKNSKK